MIASKGIQLAQEHTDLLALNDIQQKAYLECNAELLASTLSDTVISIQDGDIHLAKSAEIYEQFLAHFQAVNYLRWEDIAAPVIHLSKDGTQGSMIVKKLAVMQHLEEAGEIEAIIYAWQSSCRKENGKWKIYSHITTQEVLEYSEGKPWYEQATQAHELGNDESYLFHIERAHFFDPENLHIRYAYAEALCLNGRNHKAMEILQELAKLRYMGIFGLPEDHTFQRLTNHPQYHQLISQIELAQQAISHSQLAFQVDQRDLIPVGIAFDQKTNTFFLSSTYQRKIIGIDEAGNVQDFICSQQDEIGSTLGLAVDNRNRTLWVASSHAPSLVPLINPEQKQEWACLIYAYDLDSGQLKRKIGYDAQGEEHFFNAIILNEHGDLFISESLTGKIFTLSARSDELKVLHDTQGSYNYLTGITLSRDQRCLYVAHEDGIFVYDLFKRTLKDLQPPTDVSLQGVDGLQFYQEGLICHQSGYPINSLMYYRLDQKQQLITSSQILETHHPHFDQALTGVLVRQTYYYLANAQMQSAFEWSYPVQIRPYEELEEVYVLKMKLEGVV